MRALAFIDGRVRERETFVPVANPAPNIDQRTLPMLPNAPAAPITHPAVPVRSLRTRFGRGVVDALAVEIERPRIGPDAFPTSTAGAFAIDPANGDAVAEHAADVADYCSTPTYDPLLPGARVTRAFHAWTCEQLDGAHVRRRVIDKMGNVAASGRATLANGAVVDIDALASSYLEAAGYDHASPDRLQVENIGVTMLDVLNTVARADRVAYRGQARFIRRSVTRRRVKGAAAWDVRVYPVDRRPGRGTYYWPTVAIVDRTGWDYLPATWPADAELPQRPWTIHAVTSRARTDSHTKWKTKRATKRMAKVTGQDAAEVQNPSEAQNVVPGQPASILSAQSVDPHRSYPSLPIGALTAVHGRPVTAWTASVRSLPRILDRLGARESAVSLAALLSSAPTGEAVSLAPGLSVRVFGGMADDGEREPMPLAEYAKRAAIALM